MYPHVTSNQQCLQTLLRWAKGYRDCPLAKSAISSVPSMGVAMSVAMGVAMSATSTAVLMVKKDQSNASCPHYEDEDSGNRNDQRR
mmetsp:Transcript_3128/g.5440  ORF Transcript_3128/g.5440 Transcript_3128/m.5440 type:complete len:86 (-) Transcript_3128:1342-1599(-)